MRYQLSDSVRMLPGVGPKTVEVLSAMGIATIADLLLWRPRRYLDGTSPVPLANAPAGTLQAFVVTIDNVEKQIRRTGKRTMIRVHAHDDSADCILQWFNQPYAANKLAPESQWIVFGKLTFFNGIHTLVNPRMETLPRIIPVYPQSGEVNSRMLGKLIIEALAETAVPEVLPSSLRKLPLKTALEHLHRPQTMAEVMAAQAEMAFAEAWQYFGSLRAGQSEVALPGITIPAEVDFLKKIVDTLPFQLTNGQKRIVWDMVQEMASGKLMTRLLNGDVGSGKTVVAGILAALVAMSGHKSILLAPTEILAQQHQQSLQKLFARAGLRVGIWTASEKKMEESDLVVGTHAVLQQSFTLEKLGLVIIDEQHRFGVKQRALLREKQAVPPHVLSMTATPIPRTLALTLFAGLEVSFLRERPMGRLPIETQIVVSGEGRDRMEAMVREQVQAGRQVFVICPSIVPPKNEDGEDLQLFDQFALEQGGKKAVEVEVVRLRKVFPDLKVEMVHGKLKAAEKTATMNAMAAGEIDILVATSVVEVGVDVPNATVLIIEGAEYFGLAQLHQLRGRVGRSSWQSYCYLVPSKRSDTAMERLQVLVDSNDGFAIAEADLQYRGPGDIAGLTQAGLPDFHFASLTDLDALSKVREVQDDFLRQNPDFTFQEAFMTYSQKSAKLE